MERRGETRTHSQRVPVGPGASGQTVRSSDHAVSLWCRRGLERLDYYGIHSSALRGALECAALAGACCERGSLQAEISMAGE